MVAAAVPAGVELRRTAARLAPCRSSALGVFAATGRIVYRCRLIAEITNCQRALPRGAGSTPGVDQDQLAALALYAHNGDRHGDGDAGSLSGLVAA